MNRLFIVQIDTCNALIVFVSHQWVQENEDKGERTPDNRSGEAFRLCVQGIEQLLEESSIKITPFSPSMRRGSYQSSDPVAVSVNHHAGPLNCFLWIDYCSLMQLTSIKEPVMHLDTIMSLCDVVFTPLLEKPVSFGRKKSVVYGQKPQDSLEVNNDHGDTLFGEICSHFAWKDPNRGYLSRAWCRLEMFLGAFTPCGIAEESIRDSLSAKQVATWTKKMKSFNPDSAVGKALKRRQRVHVLCCREDKNKAGEVFSPVLEVCDDADISDTEDVVVMTDDNVAKPADVHLLYMPRAKPGHMAYYNPLAGNMSMPADRVVIISLLEKLTDRVGNLVCPVDDAKEPLGHDIDTASTAPNSHDAFDCIENDLLIFPNGDRYVGSTKRGFMHGHNGFYTYANGSTYTGDFANHSRHGLGVLKLVESSDHSEDKEQLLLIGRYEGAFIINFRVNLYLLCTGL